MASSVPIGYDEQAKIIADAINNWCSDPTIGGIAAVVPNLKTLYLQANLDTQKLRILVCFGGAKPRGPFSLASATHREDRTWKIGITKGMSPLANRGDFLTEKTGNTDAFLAQVATVRDIVRWIPTISAEGPANDYLGIEPMQLGDMIVAGYLLTFSTANDIPQPVALPPQ